MSVRELIQRSISIIKADQIVLVPYIIFAFLLTFWEKFGKSLGLSRPENDGDIYTHIVGQLVMQWGIHVIVLSFTILLAARIYHSKDIQISELVSSLIGHYKGVLLVTGVTAIPNIVLGHISLLRYQQTQSIPAEYLLALGAGILFSALFMFAPLYVITESKGAFVALFASMRLVRMQWRKVVFFLMVLLIFNMSVVFVASLFREIPLVGPSVLYVMIQGVGLAIGYVLQLVFFFQSREPLISELV